MTGRTALKRGDKVEWRTSQGVTSGTVVRTVTDTSHVEGHVAKATPAEPQVEVKSDKSGRPAIHRPDALKKKPG